MNAELLLLFETLTDTLIEQTETKIQGTLDFKKNKQMQTFSFDPPINLCEESKWSLAVSSFEATNSVFNITNENDSFSITTPGHWSSRGDAETIQELRSILQLRSKNNINCMLKKLEKMRSQIKIEDK